MKELEWSVYFLRVAKEVSKNSKCLSRKIGSVLVKDKSIVSTGYNGPSRGVEHCNERSFEFYDYYLDNCEQTKINKEKNNEIWKNIQQKAFSVIKECPRRIFGYTSGKGLHLCQAGHSERNALIQAARNGIATKDITLYCYCGVPCKDCMIEIINAGVKEIVCIKEEKDYDNYSRILAEEANVKITEIDKNLI